MRIVCLSDTHGHHDRIHVPDGDVLIHSGDFCHRGLERDVLAFAAWLDRLPHKHKVVVAGNHDRFFEQKPELARTYLEPHVIYLQDSGCVIDGLTFWGAPWQPWFMDWAFNLPRKGAALREKWNKIPFKTDVLITHGPPHGILDQVRPPTDGWDSEASTMEPLGCEELRIRVLAIHPILHVFGHIHEGYGTLHLNDTTFVNASICSDEYRPIHAPVVVDLD